MTVKNDAKQTNDKIIRKVRGLLALAEDNSNMEESQTAFLQAQKMMVKYGVDPSEVENKKVKEILTGQATDYKKLWWWERSLATVIAENFRCKWYYNSYRFNDNEQVKRRIMFVGYEKDIELAKEMYSLAHSATEFYAKRFLKKHNIQGNRGRTIQAKNDYIRGFVHGLEQKFEEQIADHEWGLVVVVPEEVKDKEQEITKDGKSISFNVPNLESHEHYQKGYQEGNAIDYTRSTVQEKGERYNEDTKHV